MEASAGMREEDGGNPVAAAGRNAGKTLRDASTATAPIIDQLAPKGRLPRS
jgi:hypothetical protein